jgi:hypothetical protein
MLNINFSERTGWVKIFNLSGEFVLQKHIQEDNSFINVENLENGVYIMQIICNNYMYMNKFVKY